VISKSVAPPKKGAPAQYRPRIEIEQPNEQAGTAPHDRRDADKENPKAAAGHWISRQARAKRLK
jgi:hypothetical protein